MVHPTTSLKECSQAGVHDALICCLHHALLKQEEKRRLSDRIANPVVPVSQLCAILRQALDLIDMGQFESDSVE